MNDEHALFARAARAVDPGATLDEPVFDGIRWPRDPDIEARLFGYLAQRGLLNRLAGLRRALGKGPGHAIRFAPAAADHQLRNSLVVANDDAAGGRCRGAPQACHGAEAALGRRAAGATPVPAQCMPKTGRSTPAVDRYGWAG